MLAKEKAIVEEIKKQEIKDMTLILVNKKKIQRFAHIVTLQDIIRSTTRRNILKSYQTLRQKLNNRKRLILTILLVIAKGTILFSILHYN